MKVLLLLCIFLGNNAHANFVVEFNKKPTSKIKAQVLAVPGVLHADYFIANVSNYFDRLLRIEVSESASELERNKILSALLLVPGALKVENVTSIEAFSVEPPASAVQVTDDQLSVYQWGLAAQNQSVVRDIDDIHPEVQIAASQSDIDWRGFTEKYEAKIKNDVVVAVVDWGVALEHPDLKEQLVPGWNFTTADFAGNARAYDDSDIGHGTHVAGIIAAISGNKIGVSGLSKKLKVMPVKVLSMENIIKPKLALADRVTQGILYAVKNGAQVINLSMGWPRSMDTTYLRNAVRIAQEKGAIIVAAAGNNSHNQTIYPCSYDGVICVGATSADGKLAPFSNFGGHVDILAPGDQILSTIPTKLNSQFFHLKGYDFLSGTSQAAPFVSAMFGILKGLFPDEDSASLSARVFSTAIADLNASFGKARLLHAIEASASAPLVIPGLKEIDLIAVPQDGSFSLPIKIKNFGADSPPVKVQAAFENQPVSLTQSNFLLPALKHGESTEIILQGKLNQLSIESAGKLTLFVKDKVFNKSLTWARNLSASNSMRVMPITAKQSVAVLSRGKIFPQIQTIQTWANQNDETSFYQVKTEKSGTGTSVNVKVFTYQQDNDQLIESPHPIEFQNIAKLVSVFKVDLNYDGKNDLFISTISKSETGAEQLNLCYFHQDLTPFFATDPCLHYLVEVQYLVPGSSVPEALVEWSKYSFISHTLANQMQIALPTFFARGVYPKTDEDPSLWDLDVKKSKYHLYQFSVSNEATHTLTLQTLDPFCEIQAWREKLNLRWDDELELIALLPQSKAQFAAKKVTALFTAGKGYYRRHFLFNVTKNLTNTKNNDTQEINLGIMHPEGLLRAPLNFIKTGESDARAGLVFTSVHSDTHASSFYFDFFGKNTATSEVQYHHPNPLDTLLTVSGHFKTLNEFYSVYISKNSLALSGTNLKTGEVYHDTFPIYRYSYLPGKVFNELFTPVSLMVNESEVPSYFIDRSMLNANQIAMIHLQDGKFHSLAEMNFLVPAGCAAMNPSKMYGASSPNQLVLLCDDSISQDGSSFVLKTIPLAISAP